MLERTRVHLKVTYSESRSHLQSASALKRSRLVDPFVVSSLMNSTEIFLVIRLEQLNKMIKLLKRLSGSCEVHLLVLEVMIKTPKLQTLK